MASKKRYEDVNFTAKSEMRDTDNILKAMEVFNVPQKISREEAWGKFTDRLAIREIKSVAESEKYEFTPMRKENNSIFAEKSISIRRRIISGMAVAATIALLLSIGFLIRQNFSDTVMESLNGERLFVELPDGSEVILNSGSKISFNANKWKKDRKTHLEGEAYFKVATGSKFTVVTENAETSVLGTSFNVFARKNDLKVTCYTGSVEVLTASGDYALLKAGDYIHGIEDKLFTLQNEANPKMNSWINGEFYFNNEPLSNVFAEMERQFNIVIDYEGSASRAYSGYFNDKSLKSALDLVCIPMQLNYQIISDQRIYIY